MSKLCLYGDFVKPGKKADGDISKKQFLEMLKKSTKKGSQEKQTPAAGASWAAVDDDYMMGSAKMKVSSHSSLGDASMKSFCW